MMDITSFLVARRRTGAPKSALSKRLRSRTENRWRTSVVTNEIKQLMIEHGDTVSRYYGFSDAFDADLIHYLWDGITFSAKVCGTAVNFEFTATGKIGSFPQIDGSFAGFLKWQKDWRREEAVTLINEAVRAGFIDAGEAALEILLLS